VIARPAVLARLRAALRRSPVVALLGPRHCGKTTLARRLVSARDPNYFDLEDPVSLARLAEPLTALRPLRGVVVVDEIQRLPDLYPVLRVLADRRPQPARFLVLGGASPELLRQSAESLAGRLETVTLGGLSLREAGAGRADRLWLRGGYPRAFLARSERESLAWRREAIRAYVEADVPRLDVRVPAAALLRFWTMIAHGHGDVWNAAQPARSLGVSEPTARRYLDLLAGLLLVRRLPPWRENLAKRQVKSPRVYVRDSGLLHRLLGIATGRDLLAHPRAGASWAGFAIEETLKCVQPDAAYFWSTYQGAGLDLLLFVGDRRVGVEVKRADGPKVTPAMRIAMADLRLERLVVVYPGERAYDLEERIRVVPLASLAEGPGAVLGSA
jgi:predicted AAA+ superfamily ATPase